MPVQYSSGIIFSLLTFHPSPQPFFPPRSNASVNHSPPCQPEMPNGLPYSVSPLQLPFTPRHHNSASFVIARQQYGCMSYIPLPYFLIVSRKRPFQNPIHNSFFLMLMLLSGDIHVNPGPSNGYSTYPSSPPPYNFAAATPPHPHPSIPSAAPPPPPPPPPSTPSAATAVHSGPPPTPPPQAATIIHLRTRPITNLNYAL